MAKTDRHWKMEEDEQARKDLGDATSSLRKIRHALSVIQGDNKKKLQHTVITLTAFFILAVMAVELHILSENKFTIIGYFLLLLAIVVVFRLAKYRILQQYYEDYRAVAEALRVQCAWWDAGLNKPEHRVDRTYLCGAAGSLALVRAGIRHLIDAAFLEKASPIANKADVKNWIEAQRDYFETRTGERGGQMLRFERAIWFLFDASLGMALSSIPLALLLANTDGALSSFVAPIDKLLMNTPGLWFLATLMLVIATVVMFMRALNSGQANPARHIRKRRWTFEHSNIVRGFVAGILMAIAVYIFVAGAHPFDGPVSHFVTHHMSACSGHGDLDKIHCSHNLAHNLTITMMIILASSAGALRFYSERLAMESELHAYREALEVFRRAENVLIVNQTPVSAERYDSIVLELGMQALKESESWIRAHRVRPLEPHV